LACPGRQNDANAALAGIGPARGHNSNVGKWVLDGTLRTVAPEAARGGACSQSNWEDHARA